ncbi:MAG: hypothetical protein ACXV5J_13525 [Candidatus Angelobacter sp.]
MDTTTQDARKPRLYAGFYWRTRSRTRFWGWGNPPAFAVEQPWANVADWLRLAHSLAGTGRDDTHSKTSGVKTLPAIQSVEEQTTDSAAPREKRKLRFVCDRHFFGLVYR